MTAPLISVILPVYNGEPFLADALASVRRQTLDDFELLTIDDQSTDGSAAYLDQVMQDDPRIRVVRNPKKGLVEALNLGLSLARGEFVARMDADDISLPIRFERQIGFLRNFPEIAVVGTDMTCIDGAGNVVDRVYHPTEPGKVHAMLGEGRCVVAHPTVMGRRAALLSAGGYREAFRHAEDYDLWLRVAESNRIGNLADRLVRYRYHGGRVSLRHAHEQRLAARVALLCARARRAGKPDPMVGRTTLSLADLQRFDIDDAERAVIIHSVLNPPPSQPSMRLPTWFKSPVHRLLRYWPAGGRAVRRLARNLTRG